MSKSIPQPVSLDAAWASMTFLPDRTPATESTDHFATVTPYRDSGVFLAHYAGSSEWERHRQGDEIVMVVGGSTTVTLLIADEEVAHTMGTGQLIVVPQGTWHRFETPAEVKVMTVTPEPTDHYVGDRPPPD